MARFGVGVAWRTQALLRGVARYDVARVRREPYSTARFGADVT
ncbi:hypothetical protein [uncultured Campylobacter sp.]|nr:hypothetical protein [uncultured Campylobacter sp.]